VKGSGRLDLGLDVEREFLEQQVGVAGSAFFLEDGSGLAPGNLIAPEAVVALLGYVTRQPWRDTYVRALAGNGEGTLGGWGNLPPVRAKTGTIQHTLGLAGMLHPEQPEPTLFAIFINHRTNRDTARSEMISLLKRWSAR
jgi:D-alanyl-D-alanine carboxypeptidase